MTRYLAIDGNYFATRCIMILNQGDNVNNLETDLECQNYYEALKVQFAKVWDILGRYCDNVIFVADSWSWRKQLKPFLPYYVKKQMQEEEGIEINIEYKGLRQEYKEKSDINYDNLYKIFGQFVDMIYDKIPTFRIDGLEGDDILCLLSKKIIHDHDQCCIFATDKDLTQLIDGGMFMYSNTKSKKSPYGSFIISKEISEAYIPEKPDPLKMLMARNGDDATFKQMLHIDMYDRGNTIDRSFQSGIEISSPNKTILTKIVCGDKSDNILPLIRWYKDDKTYSVTEKMIERAFYNMMENYNEGTCKMILNDNDAVVDLLGNLMIITKQKTSMTNLREHFNHNRKLVELDPKYFPEESKKKFETKYQELLPKLYKNVGYEYIREVLGLATAQISDKATNILRDSIPEDF